MRTGVDHYSLAFTYDCIAWTRDTWYGSSRVYCPDFDPDAPDYILDAVF